MTERPSQNARRRIETLLGWEWTFDGFTVRGHPDLALEHRVDPRPRALDFFRSLFDVGDPPRARWSRSWSIHVSAGWLHLEGRDAVKIALARLAPIVAVPDQLVLRGRFLTPWRLRAQPSGAPALRYLRQTLEHARVAEHAASLGRSAEEAKAREALSALRAR